MFGSPHPQPVSTFGSLHLPGALWTGVGADEAAVVSAHIKPLLD